MHRIRIEKFVPNQPLEDHFRKKRLQPDEEIIKLQDDLYTVTWETNFGEQLATRGNQPISTSLPKGEQPVTTNPDLSDTHENELDYIILNDSPNAVHDAAHKRNEGLNDDVRKKHDDIEAEVNENSDWQSPAV